MLSYSNYGYMLAFGELSVIPEGWDGTSKRKNCILLLTKSTQYIFHIIQYNPILIISQIHLNVFYLVILANKKQCFPHYSLDGLRDVKINPWRHEGRMAHLTGLFTRSAV